MRSVEVTEELLREMRRDAVRLLLVRRSTGPLRVLTGCVLVGTALLLGVASATDAPVDQPSATVLVVLCGVLVVWVVVPPLLFDRWLRAVLRNGYAIGSTVTASARADDLRVEDATGLLELRYTAFRRVRTGPSTVLLEQGPGAFLLVPRAAFTDDDLERLLAAVDHRTAPV